jgi:putative CocE/NonD family hydrolase
VAAAVPWVGEWIEHADPTDGYWAERDPVRRLGEIDTPMLHIGGWHDLFIRGTVRAFAMLRERSGASQRMVIHPFGHAGAASMGERSFAVDLAPDPFAVGGLSPAPVAAATSRWLDRYLRGVPNGVENEAPITIYVMGDDVWRDEWEWPLARTRWTKWFLHSGGAANGRDGDGRLDTASPGDERPDSYTYDPRDPVPSTGGTFLGFGSTPGMFDQRDVESRPDVLVYTSAPLASRLEVTGPVRCELWASTDAVDTDFTAKLVDVDAAGHALNVCDGVTRLRFRGDRPGPVVPGEVQHVVVELSPTSYVFAAGHHVRLQVSSSNFPLFDPNPNTGASLLASSAIVVAGQTVYHDATRPSALVLPVIPD